jgi:hypothetical protein
MRSVACLLLMSALVLASGRGCYLHPTLRSRRHQQLGPSFAATTTTTTTLHEQRWVLAEVVDRQDAITGSSRPDWARSTQDLLQANAAHNSDAKVDASLSLDNPTWTIRNESPLWVAILAEIVAYDGCSIIENPSSDDLLFGVSPVDGYLAPKGGTTNLCNEHERYQDFCEFRVTYPSDEVRVVSSKEQNDTISVFLIVQNEENERWIIEVATGCSEI